MTSKKAYGDWTKEELISELEILRKLKTYGLVWERDKNKENFDYYINWDGVTTQESFSENGAKFPVLKSASEMDISSDKNSNQTHILIEGDNYHSLGVLNFTHNESVDLIYIDPPYNTGKKDFKYNDQWIDSDDSYKHSKWLSFMSKRLQLAKKLLRRTGLMVVHIDENESSNLHILMNEIFGENNYLGTIIWDKRNPKGDAKGVAYQHESILVYARSKADFLERRELVRPKANAEAMLQKAKELFDRIGQIDLPADLKECVKKYSLSGDTLKNFNSKIDIQKVNTEFANWLKKQDFSGGEKAYSKIDEDGHVFRLVSMAWPNKKKAPDDYFIPLIHPDTKKACPIPSRGWRYPPKTMEKLMTDGLIIFGKDHAIQPQRKYYLHENMTENIPSIVSYAGSDDGLLNDLDISFENPKPTNFCMEMIKYFSQEGDTVLDFFAGSGTVGHAVLALNKEESHSRKFILCTNNEGGICTEVCHPRVKKSILGYKGKKGKPVEGLGGNLKYFRTDFVDALQTDENRKQIVDKSTEMLCLKENTFDEFKSTKGYKVYKSESHYTGIIFDEEAIDSFVSEAKKIDGTIHVYVFSLDESVPTQEFREVSSKVKLCPIPEVILHVYRRIFRND